MIPPSNNFQWLGPEVECYDPSINSPKHKFYESFIYNDETYTKGDFIMIKNIENTKIGRILCVYESLQKDNPKYFGKVTWFTKLSSLPKVFTRYIDYDKEKELVEDLRNGDNFISLENIIDKCCVVFGTINDSIQVLKEMQLDKEDEEYYYFCRYKLHKNKLNPILKGAGQTTIIEDPLSLQDFTPEIKTNPKKNPSYYKISPVKTPSSTPSKVKRNLNESFNSQTDTPILNYSIINEEEEAEDIKNDLKIKLRLSTRLSDTPKKNKTNSILYDKRSSKDMKLILKTFDEDYVVSIPKNLVKQKEMRKLRKSVMFDDDDDYIPETRSTPRKIAKIDETAPSPRTRSRLHGESTSIDESLRTPRTRRKLLEESIENLKIESPRTPRTRRLTLKNIDENPQSPSKTPQKRKMCDELSTPKKNIMPKTPKTPKTTPGARMKLIRQGLITPSMHSRQSVIIPEGTPLQEARVKLHVSYVPKALPCREKEFNDVLNFVQGKLWDGFGGCMYISGVPGTGKTASVTEVIRTLQKQADGNEIPKFSFVGINGMKLTEPRQAYVEILKQLTGKTVPWEQAQSTLDTRFANKKSGTKKSDPIVLLVDELDILCTKRQDVVYNLLDWPTKASAQLIVITIANTMDLPERLLMGRVTSRLGLTRLTFQAYTYKQLQEIVMKRLMGTDAFNPDAVQLVARKVASVSGDARRALDICRRSAEVAELEGPNTLVSMTHVNEALNTMITQPKVRAIKHCSRLEQLILQSVVAEVERTGVDETTFHDIFRMLSSVAAIDGFQMVSASIALAAVSRLGACRLLLADPKTNDLHQKLILNVSPDDIFYALRKD